ncbi:MAG TPA: glycosyltransferase family 4 protein, partial [Tepidisphaeraceae bacterium]|nr:glycosyltransferase family 4 protein [Tepidisphaeraceae bacterium]
ERYTIDLARGLAHRGHDVHLISTSFVDIPWEVRQDKMPGNGLTRLSRYNRFLYFAEQHVATTPYDVTHAMLPVRRADIYHPHAGVEAESITTVSSLEKSFNLKRKKAVAVEHDLIVDREPTVLCLSNYVKAAVKKHYEVDEKKLVVLHNGVSLKKFDPNLKPDAGKAVRKEHGIGEKKLVGLIVAQDFERKGVATAIMALAKASDARLTLLVVGKDNPGKYIKLARKRGIAEYVTFAGATKDVYAAYQAADFFVLPTRHDPCSLVVLEALVMGKPVISTRYNGATEVMTSGKHGFVLDKPTDVDALCDAMKQMLNDTKRLAMAKQCLTLRPKLSQDHHVDEVTRLYVRLTGVAPVTV